MDNTIYVTGHKHPDTDTIISSIAYAYLKNQLGIKCVACRLGDVNDETKFLLDRFGYEEPKLLGDARFKLEDIEIDAPISISKNDTIYDAMVIMANKKISYLGITDEDGTLEGMISLPDLSVLGLGDTKVSKEYMSQISCDNLARVLKGNLIYKADHVKNGKVCIVPATSTGLTDYDVKDRIVVVGNDVEVQRQAIQMGCAILILVWEDTIDDEVLRLAKENNCTIIQSKLGGMNTTRYIFFSIGISSIMHRQVVSFNKNEIIQDVGEKMLETRFETYPVVDDENHLLGFVNRNHIMRTKNRKVALVDHNESSQSINEIQFADIVEVIDHHRIGDFTSVKPIHFRNETVGSTATILACVYEEQNVEIIPSIAGLLLGAILSDTLNFSSPTTTPKDRLIAQKLADIAGLDIPSFANDMFSVYQNIMSKPIEEVIKTDIKLFDIHGANVLVSQIMMYDFKAIQEREKDFRDVAKSLVSSAGDTTIVLCFTSIGSTSTMFYCEGKRKEQVETGYKPNVEYKDVVSRKLQIVPTLTSLIK